MFSQVTSCLTCEMTNQRARYEFIKKKKKGLDMKYSRISMVDFIIIVIIFFSDKETWSG